MRVRVHLARVHRRARRPRGVKGWGVSDRLDDVLTEVEATAGRRKIDSLLGLDSVGKHVARVRVYGRGGRAHVRLDLDDGEWIVLDPLGAYSSPAKMNFEIAAQAGAKPTLK